MSKHYHDFVMNDFNKPKKKVKKQFHIVKLLMAVTAIIYLLIIVKWIV